jgi:hypothetical protein
VAIKPEKALNTNLLTTGNRVKMPEKEEKVPSRKFSDLFRISWIRSSVKIGIIFPIIGLMMIFVLKVINAGSNQLFLDARVFVAQYGFVGIFLATILAGTLLPLGSPGLVVAAALLGVPLVPLILVATVGFTLV